MCFKSGGIRQRVLSWMVSTGVTTILLWQLWSASPTCDTSNVVRTPVGGVRQAGDGAGAVLVRLVSPPDKQHKQWFSFCPLDSYHTLLSLRRQWDLRTVLGWCLDNQWLSCSPPRTRLLSFFFLSTSSTCVLLAFSLPTLSLWHFFLMQFYSILN